MENPEHGCVIFAYASERSEGQSIQTLCHIKGSLKRLRSMDHRYQLNLKGSRKLKGIVSQSCEQSTSGDGIIQERSMDKSLPIDRNLCDIHRRFTRF